MSEGLPPMPKGTKKRGVYDVIKELDGKKGDKAPTILIRVDFNVPMQGGKITDDSRIRGALPTIKAVTMSKCNAVLVSHMGRPKLVQKGGSDDETTQQRKDLSLKPVAEHLSGLIGKPVLFGEDCLKSQDTVAQLPKEGGGICLLENLRFYKEEEKNDEAFAKTLAGYADGYVNDAFGTSHRAHGSTAGVPNLMANEVCGIGILVASELAYLDFSTLGPNEKVAAIIGGSKVSTKLPVIQGLLKSVQTLVLGGGIANTFVAALGLSVGSSLCEDDMIETAKGIMAQAEKEGKKILIPVDAVCTQSFPKEPVALKDTKTFDTSPGAGGIDAGWMALDCGPKSVECIKTGLADCTKIVMNGPLGVFEVPCFDQGTRGLVDVLEALTKKGAITVVGGGDSVAALEAFGKTGAVSYVSTGGGATLELLAGDILPGVAAIADL